jgi:hypothetical protein
MSEALGAVPERPALYTLPTKTARQAGLPIDATTEIELRQAMHQAEVPNVLAQTMYFAAVTAATRQDQFSVAQDAAYRRGAHELHTKWGDAFDANLATANAEARRIFETMPASVTHGLSYADWCRASGIANHRIVVEQLHAQARARKR